MVLIVCISSWVCLDRLDCLLVLSWLSVFCFIVLLVFCVCLVSWRLGLFRMFVLLVCCKRCLFLYTDDLGCFVGSFLNVFGSVGGNFTVLFGSQGIHFGRSWPPKMDVGGPGVSLRRLVVSRVAPKRKYHFFPSHFGAVFWDHCGVTNHTKTELKADGFVDGFGSILGGLCNPWQSKIKLSCKRDAHFERIVFVRSRSKLNEFWMWTRGQKGINLESKKVWTIHLVVGWFWDASGNIHGGCGGAAVTTLFPADPHGGAILSKITIRTPHGYKEDLTRREPLVRRVCFRIVWLRFLSVFRDALARRPLLRDSCSTYCKKGS